MVLEKPQQTFNQQKSYRVLHILCRALILFGIVATSALLICLARPWEDIFAPELAPEYWGFLYALFWVTTPYLPLLVIARKPHPVRALNLLRLIGAAIICLGGVGIYLDVYFRHADPLSFLVFIAVPFYQWGAVAPLVALDYFFQWRHREANR
jgi:hypothetical protein